MKNGFETDPFVIGIDFVFFLCWAEHFPRLAATGPVVLCASDPAVRVASGASGHARRRPLPVRKRLPSGRRRHGRTGQAGRPARPRRQKKEGPLNPVISSGSGSGSGSGNGNRVQNKFFFQINPLLLPTPLFPLPLCSKRLRLHHESKLCRIFIGGGGSQVQSQGKKQINRIF